MHDTALAIGAAVMAEYAPSRATIVEIGAMNVNGTLRSVAPPKAKYIGIDQQAGPGVDIVVPPGTAIPVAPGTADLVMASSVLEHDMMFWATFTQMCQLAKLGGYIYLNVPSNGSVHSYPVDCWRFYPDAGMALERYSEKTEWPVKLTESFIAERQGDQWNDFVAVFRRSGGVRRKKHTHIYHQFNSKNVYAENVGQRINTEEYPEDVRIGRLLQQRATDLEAMAGAAQGEVNRLSQEIAARDGRTHELEAAVGAAQGETGRLSQEVAARDGRIGELEAAVEATQGEVGRLAQEVVARDGRIGGLEAAIAATQGEVALLSHEVATRDARIGELEAAAGAAQAEVGRLGQEVSVRDGRIGELEAATGVAQGEVGRLGQEVSVRDGRIAELEAAVGVVQGEVGRLSQEVVARDGRIGELDVALAATQNEAGRLAQELATQMTTVAELRRFVTTLSDLIVALRNSPKTSWNPFRLFRRTAPPLLLEKPEAKFTTSESSDRA